MFERNVVFLGHKVHVSANGIQPDPANVENFAAWKPPENANEGLEHYYRKLCHNCASIAETRCPTVFIWR